MIYEALEKYDIYQYYKKIVVAEKISALYAQEIKENEKMKCVLSEILCKHLEKIQKSDIKKFYSKSKFNFSIFLQESQRLLHYWDNKEILIKRLSSNKRSTIKRLYLLYYYLKQFVTKNNVPKLYTEQDVKFWFNSTPTFGEKPIKPFTLPFICSHKPFLRYVDMSILELESNMIDILNLPENNFLEYKIKLDI